MKFDSKYKTFQSRIHISKCRLRNGSHFVQGRWVKLENALRICGWWCFPRQMICFVTWCLKLHGIVSGCWNLLVLNLSWGNMNIFITHNRQVILFLLSVLVYLSQCFWEIITQEEDWCHTKNIMQVCLWGCVVVKVILNTNLFIPAKLNQWTKPSRLECQWAGPLLSSQSLPPTISSS